MNTRTLAATLAALLFPFAAASAQDDPRLQDLDTAAERTTQDTATDEPEASGNYPWGEPELPPPANPDPAPADPRVPTVDELDDPMVTPPEPDVPPDVPPPDVDTAPMDTSDRWSQLDADGDGRITAEEGRIDADFHSSFEMMDRNSDGFIDSTELDEAGSPEDGRDSGVDRSREADRSDHTDAVDAGEDIRGVGDDDAGDEGSA
ncbi:hypothetical protein [Novilysobacter defluvii]|nr:hypothetical protein [Lysobacter defluvii]